MPNEAEDIKLRHENPFEILKTLEGIASGADKNLSDEELFICQWIGLRACAKEAGYFMLRTRQPNGWITPNQLEAIAEIAQRQSRGFADITTRQDLQLHRVHYTQAAVVIKQLQALGVSTLGTCSDTIRNVVGCPVSGVDKEEILDASPIVKQVSDYFLGKIEYANLPRKCKISISGCKDSCENPQLHCLSFSGITRTLNEKTEVGFSLRIGGGLSTQPFISQQLNVFAKPEEVLDIIRHAIDIWANASDYRQDRQRSRLKFLINDFGPAKFRQALEERLGRPLENLPADFKESADTYRDHIGVHAQKQSGLYYIGSPVLAGRMSAQQMRKIADLCRRYGDGQHIRLTNRQNIIILNVSEQNVEKVLSSLSDIGLSINAHPIRRSIVCCTGSEFCSLALTETKARSRQIAEYLERRLYLDEPLRLHISGCSNACAHHQIAHIGLVGTKTVLDAQEVEAYDIFVAARMGCNPTFNHPIMRGVPSYECAKRLEWLLVGFTQQRKEKESFNDWCARVGDAVLVKLLSVGPTHPLSDVPAVAPQVVDMPLHKGAIER